MNNCYLVDHLACLMYCKHQYCGSSSEGLDSRSNNIDSDVKALSCQLAQYLLSHDLFG